MDRKLIGKTSVCPICRKECDAWMKHCPCRIENNELMAKFDRQFVKDNGPDVEPSFSDPHGQVGPVKAFIREALQAERARLRTAVEAMDCLTVEEHDDVVFIKADKLVRLEDVKKLLSEEEV